MSKNGPTTVRVGFSAVDAIASKVPIVPLRTDGQLNLTQHLKGRSDLLPVVEARRSEGLSDGKIVDWLKDHGLLGSFRLKTWVDEARVKPPGIDYAATREVLKERAEAAFAKRLCRHARLAEFSPKTGRWMLRDRWPPKARKKQK